MVPAPGTNWNLPGPMRGPWASPGHRSPPPPSRNGSTLLPARQHPARRGDGNWLWPVVAAIAALSPGVQARAATLPDAPDATSARILTPTQGRPVFSRPSSPILCLLYLPDGSEPPRLFLQSSRIPRLRYPLLPMAAARNFGEGYIETQMAVAASTPPGLYDLILTADNREVVNRRSVSVVSSFKSVFRFVHLSNMNIDEPTAPDFDHRLPEEINLLAPEFIVATGDFTEWARLRDRQDDWWRVLDYMALFDAPVYLLCGDHDHQDSFTRLVANSPVGTIDYGPYHGLLLLDHGYHPIEQDDEQIRWVLQDLEANRHRTFNFVVTHSDELGLIRRLREMAAAEKAVRDFKLRMILCGGHTDWNYREFAWLLSGLSGLHYVRTAQSSTALTDGAPGQSHYRVIEVNHERISYVYPEDYSNPQIQHSVPADRIRVIFASANDGTHDPVTATISSTLNRPWNSCRLWLNVRKGQTGALPSVAGGTLLRCLDAGSFWACQVGFDLPDKGAVTVQAGTAERLAAPPPTLLEFNCPDRLTFTPRSAASGLTWFTCLSPATLKVINPSSRPACVWPVVRLNGANLPLSGSGSTALPVVVQPQSVQLLRINLTLGQLALGPHMLQAYLLDDPLQRLTTQQTVLLSAADLPEGPTATRPADPPSERHAEPAATQSTQPVSTSREVPAVAPPAF